MDAPKVRIVSDGTPQGTYVYDEHGQRMTSVVAVSFSVSVEELGRVQVEFDCPEVDLIGEHVPPPPPYNPDLQLITHIEKGLG
jgi:hypothetical protein